jgi:protein-L-isoaspartate(D-aspartate) O-methyltransferase
MVNDRAAPRTELVDQLRQHGITDLRVLDAIGQIERERFVPEDERDQAYRNAPVPIGEGQTISQPYVVALMLQELRLTGDERVLEIGTGSGYQTALLAELAGEVTSVERIDSFADRARALLAELNYVNVTVHLANGTLGWPARAPYDAIVVSAGSPSVPDSLLAQLADGGRLILPVGSRKSQDLVLVERHGDEVVQQKRGRVRFVPLLGDEAWGANDDAG